jgi:hypothetical protein
MANNNLVNSKVKMKDKIRLMRVDSSAEDITKLAKSARFVGLVDDAEVESDINAEMTALIPNASIDELVDMSEGLRELKDPKPNFGLVSTTDSVAEGSNKYMSSSSFVDNITVEGDLTIDNGVIRDSGPAVRPISVLATESDLPVDAQVGDEALVQENNKLFIRTQDGWYAVALVNTAPTVSGNQANYSASVGDSPIVITMTAVDPENDPIDWSYEVTGNLNGISIAQSDNVFTITPSAAAVFDITFAANDSVNVVTSTSRISVQ